MGKLNDAGSGIGDFAKSLMESGKISRGNSTGVESAVSELPTTDVDISKVPVSNSMVDQVLQESFGMGNEAPKRETVREPLLSEQELLQEKITSLKEELVETINKLSSLVLEMAGVSTTMGIAPRMGGGNTVTSKYTSLRDPKKKKKMKQRARSGNIRYT